MNKIVKHCIICEKRFEVWPCLNRIKCCSRKCSNLSKRGRHLSLEHRKKLSIIAKQKGFGKWMIGKKASEKSKRKMRQNSNPYWKGRKMPKWLRTKLSIAHKRPTYKPFSKCNGQPIIDGYRFIKNHTHSNRTKNNYILEHRLVAEKLISRPLEKTEIVHHINGNKRDNRPKNLMVFKNTSAHIRWHVIQNGLKKDDIIYSPKSL